VQSTLVLTLSPTLESQVGSHTCQVKALLVSYPTQTSQASFTVQVGTAIVTDPCLSAVWSNPTIINMDTTVNAVPLNQNIAAFTTTPSCGGITYEVQKASFMTFDLPTMTFTSAPTSAADVGSYSCSIVARLDTYPTLVFSSVSFTANVAADLCLSAVWSNPTIQPISGTVSASPVTQPITAFSTNPSCGSISYELACPGLFMTFDLTTLTLTLAPTLAADVGSHIC